MELDTCNSLLGVIIGASILLVKDLLLSRNQRALEIIKLHEKDKMDAYKHLLKYARGLTVITWPDNNSVYADFIQNCRKEFSKLVEFYPYYSENIMKVLDRIENLYNITIIDADWITPPRESIEKELPELARRLYQQVIDDFRKWTFHK